jgi:23S rRNA pseudouridine2604 synthase
MAEDSKRSKLTLPAKPAGSADNSSRRRAPLRGGNQTRTQRDGLIGRERPREGQGRFGDDRRPRPDSDGRRASYGDRPQRPREDRPARDDSRPRFNDRREGGNDRGFGDRGPRPPRPASEGRRESYGDRPQRPREDRPARDESRPRFNDRREGGNDRGFGDRGPRPPRPDFAGRRESYGDRPQRPREDRPTRDDSRPRFNDRREGGNDRGFGDRGPRPPRPAFEGRRESYGDRPQRPREDRPARDESRPRFNDHREGGNDRGFGDRGPRPPRPAFEGRRESYGDRPQRPREDRPARDESRPRFNDRREGGNDRGFGDRSPRPAFEGRRESYGDRPQRPREDRPSRDDSRPRFNDHREGRNEHAPAEDRPYRANPHVRVYRADDNDRPSRGFAERPAFRTRAEEHPRAESPHDEQPAYDEANAPRAGRSFARGRNTAQEDAADTTSGQDAEHHIEDAPGSLRLSKRMSELGLCSRREADNYIERGWVKVDGEIISELGHKVLPDQHIELTVVAEEMQMSRVTILINKPIGYVSGQAEDDHEPAYVLVTPENHWDGDPVKRPFEPKMVRKLAPAGRLDIDSTGLLVLTQDGRVAKHLIGERSDVEKEYLVRVEGDLIEGGLEMLRHGIELDGVELEPAKVSWQNEDQLRIVLHEGRKRQIRRMCELVGLRVVGLKRVRIGQIPLGKLPVGQWRFLSEHEEF